MSRRILIAVCISLFPFYIKAQEIEEEVIIKQGFNLRYNLSYNYRTLHNTFTLGYNFGNHQLYAGPGHVAILPPFGNPLREHQGHTFGGTVGYRNYFYVAPRDIKLFGQFQFSFYPVSYSVPALQVERSTDFVLENTLSFGSEFRLTKNYDFNLGVGIGSTDGIFLVRSSFFFLGFIGIQYHFGDLPKIRK
jgi:hypothetical protein